MNYKVCDNRIMVSFGEKCVFKCKYCYTSASTFENYPNRNADLIVDAIRNFPDRNFENIYISCDMEAFVDQKRAIELIKKLVTLDKDIHFTTKMILSDTTIESIARINDELNQNGRMLIPAITICAMESSKELEPDIPSPHERIETIIKLNEKGLKVILAMRPFLPSVGLNEYKEILDLTAKHIESVLGGMLFLDLEGNIERKLGLNIENFQLQPMYFIDKPGMWKVYIGEREQRFVEEYCKYLKKDFFMTSPPAIERIKRKYLRR
jgi:DNA repair photolyase